MLEECLCRMQAYSGSDGCLMCSLLVFVTVASIRTCTVSTITFIPVPPHSITAMTASEVTVLTVYERGPMTSGAVPIAIYCTVPL